MAALSYPTQAERAVRLLGGLPKGEDISNALFAQEAIEWNRFSVRHPFPSSSQFTTALAAPSDSCLHPPYAAGIPRRVHAADL